MADLNAYVKCTQGFLAKSDGKDKLLALLQYAAMLASGGEPGNAIQVQKNLAAARKPFRIMKPMETAVTLLKSQPKNAKPPVVLIDKVKNLGMVLYFAADHFVWADASGLYKDKELSEKAAKVSNYGWLVGSVCSILLEAIATSEAETKKDQSNESSKEVWERRQKHSLVFAGNICQVCVACAALGIVPMKPRTVATLGLMASAISCYQLMPAVAPKPKAA